MNVNGLKCNIKKSNNTLVIVAVFVLYNRKERKLSFSSSLSHLVKTVNS